VKTGARFATKRTRNLGMSVLLHVMVKVKDSRNRPGVAQMVPGGLDSQIFMTFST
jgi:hypothetical protein